MVYFLDNQEELTACVHIYNGYAFLRQTHLPLAI